MDLFTKSESTHCPLFFTLRWHHASGWSEHQWYSLHWTSLGSQTWWNCWRHRLADTRQEIYAIPGGGLGVALEPGTREPSCVIASGVSEEMGALTVSHAHGSAKTLYKTFVCFKMGVFVKESGSYRRPTTCTVSYVLSFPLHRLDSGSLPSTLKSMSRPLPCSFPAERAIVR